MSVLCLSSVCVLIVLYRLYYQLRKVSGGGGWWVVGVSVIIASALVLLRQELRPVLENSLG